MTIPKLSMKKQWEIWYRSIRTRNGYNSQYFKFITEKHAKKMLWYANRVYNACHKNGYFCRFD